MPETINLQQALQAQQALREAASLPPEQFPIEAFVGMISDEVEILRTRGKSDDDIAQIIREKSGIDITATQITENYASPEQRQGAHEHA